MSAHLGVSSQKLQVRGLLYNGDTTEDRDAGVPIKMRIAYPLVTRRVSMTVITSRNLLISWRS